MKAIILVFSLILISKFGLNSQTVMNIYQNDGTVLQIPLNNIDSITYTITNPGNLATISTLPIGNITGTAVTRGGGGGGGRYAADSFGGTGGGGRGRRTGAGAVLNSSGENNTGGGGGGGHYNNNYSNGGSGVVIVRYPGIYNLTIGSGLVGTTQVVGIQKVTTLTAGTGNVSWAVS
jgi:hypothetical protein